MYGRLTVWYVLCMQLYISSNENDLSHCRETLQSYGIIYNWTAPLISQSSHVFKSPTKGISWQVATMANLCNKPCPLRKIMSQA